MVLKLLITIIIFSLLFYIITFPYESKLQRKMKRVLSFEEVSYVSKDERNFNRYDFDGIEEKLNIDEIFVESSHVNEKMRYIELLPKEKYQKILPCLILFHGIRDYPEDWINRAYLIENYLTLKEMNLVGDMVFSSCFGI